jgi:hypothetical protein
MPVCAKRELPSDIFLSQSDESLFYEMVMNGLNEKIDSKYNNRGNTASNFIESGNHRQFIFKEMLSTFGQVKAAGSNSLVYSRLGKNTCYTGMILIWR